MGYASPVVAPIFVIVAMTLIGLFGMIPFIGGLSSFGMPLVALGALSLMASGNAIQGALTLATTFVGFVLSNVRFYVAYWFTHCIGHASTICSSPVSVTKYAIAFKYAEQFKHPEIFRAFSQQVGDSDSLGDMILNMIPMLIERGLSHLLSGTWLISMNVVVDFIFFLIWGAATGVALASWSQ